MRSFRKVLSLAPVGALAALTVGMLVMPHHVAQGSTTWSATDVSAPYTVEDKPLGLIVGDSFAEGITGVNRPGGGLAYQVADKLGWTLAKDAQGGTGYIAQGPVELFANRASFPIRLQRHTNAERVSYVLLTGGANDSAASDTVLAAAVHKTILETQQLWPSAKIIVVAPFWCRADAPAGLLRIRNVIKTQAAVSHVAFIDPLAERWTTAQNESWMVFRDGVHPSQRGHDYIAARLAAAVKKLGVPVNQKIKRGSWFPEDAAAVAAPAA